MRKLLFPANFSHFVRINKKTHQTVSWG